MKGGYYRNVSMHDCTCLFGLQNSNVGVSILHMFFCSVPTNKVDSVRFLAIASTRSIAACTYMYIDVYIVPA